MSGGFIQGIYTNVLTWINGNTIWGNTDFGIHLDTGSSSSQILGNTIYDNGDNGIHLGGSSVATCVIQDNYFTNVTGTQPRGIYEASGNGPTTALGNYIIGQVTTPYYFSNRRLAVQHPGQRKRTGKLRGIRQHGGACHQGRHRPAEPGAQ